MSLKVLSLTVPKQFDFDYPDEKKLRHALSDFGFNVLCKIDGKKESSFFHLKRAVLTMAPAILFAAGQ